MSIEMKVLSDREEIWKAVPDFEGLYEVSNFGKVKSLERNGTKGGLLKQPLDRYGYRKIALYKNNKRYNFTVHRLVAKAFIPNPENKTTVDHIDCNRTNNNADNLRWCTTMENIYHSHKLGRQKWTAKRLIGISPSGKQFKFSSQHEAERITGVSQSNVGKCANGKIESVKGWIFKYD